MQLKYPHMAAPFQSVSSVTLIFFKVDLRLFIEEPLYCHYTSWKSESSYSVMVSRVDVIGRIIVDNEHWLAHDAKFICIQDRHFVWRFWVNL